MDTTDPPDAPKDPLVPVGDPLPIGSDGTTSMDLVGSRAAICSSGTLHLATWSGTGFATVPGVDQTPCRLAALTETTIVTVTRDGDVARATWTDSAAPSLTGIGQNVGEPRDIASAGELVAIASETAVTVWIGDEPSLAVELPAAPAAIALSGSRVVVAGDDWKLSVLDLQTGGMLGSTELAGAPVDVAARAERAWAALGSGGLETVNVGEPAVPVSMRIDDLDGLVVGVAVFGDDGLVLANHTSLEAYRVTDAGDLVFVGSERRSRPHADPVTGAYRASPALALAADGDRVLAGFEHALVGLVVHESTLGGDLVFDSRLRTLRTIPVGQTASFALVLRNRGNGPMFVEEPSDTAPFALDRSPFASGPVLLDPEEAIAVEGAFEQVDSEWVQRDAVFASDDPDEPEIAVTLVANWPGIEVGDAIPMDLVVPDARGAARRLADYAGDVMILKFFNFL